MSNEKQQPTARILRVTLTVDYYIEEHEHRPIDEIAKDWFVDFPETRGGFLAAHAYRDGSEIGNSKRYIKHEEVRNHEQANS